MKSHHLLILPTLASAFFPTKFRDGLHGRPGTSHQSLTIDSLTDIVFTLDALSSNLPSSSPSAINSTDPAVNDTQYLPRAVVSAIRAMARAAAEVDVLEMEDAAWHFDGEQIREGQLLLTALRSAVVDSLQKGEAEVARVLLGKALHGVQDFYAHTNWIELGKSELAPLGRGIDLEFAGPMDGTCSSCSTQGPVPFVGDGTVCQDCVGLNAGMGQLTSGFFVESDAQPLTGGKCRHGGPYDDETYGAGNRTSTAIFSEETAPYPYYGNGTTPSNTTGTASNPFPTSTSFVNATISHPPRNSTTTATEAQTMPIFVAGINKDSMDCFWSPHSHLHSDAVSFASAATKQFVEDLMDELSPMQFRILFGLPEKQVYHGTNPISGPGINGTTHVSTSSIPGVLLIPSSKTLMRASENYDPISMLSLAPIVLAASSIPSVSEPAIFPIPVDSHMSFLSIGISCTACTVSLTPPDSAAPLGSDFQQAVDATGTHARMNVTEPQIGVWTLSLSGASEQSGEGTFAVAVEGESPVHMAEFAFVESAGRAGHEGYFEIGDTPPMDTLIGATSEVYGPASAEVTPIWVIRGADYGRIKNSSVVAGDEIDQVPVLILEGGSGEEGYPETWSYFGLTKLPQSLSEPQPDSNTNSTQGFYVYVTGIDDNDRQFQRVHPIRFSTSKASREYKIGSLDPLFRMINGALMNPAAKSIIPNAAAAATVPEDEPLSVRVNNSSTTLFPFPTASTSFLSTMAPLMATAPHRNTTGQTTRATGMSTGLFPRPSSGIHGNGIFNGTAFGSTGVSGRMTGVTVSAADPTGFDRTTGETAMLTMGPSWTSRVEPSNGGNRTGPSVVFSTPFVQFPTFSERSSRSLRFTSKPVHENTVTVTITDCADEIESVVPETTTSSSLSYAGPSDLTAPPGGYGLPTSYSVTSTTAPPSYTVITSAITSTSTIVSTNIITSTLDPYEPEPTTTLSSYGLTTSTDDALRHTHTSLQGPQPSVIDNGAGEAGVGTLGFGVVGLMIVATMFVWA